MRAAFYLIFVFIYLLGLVFFCIQLGDVANRNDFVTIALRGGVYTSRLRPAHSGRNIRAQRGY